MSLYVRCNTTQKPQAGIVRDSFYRAVMGTLMAVFTNKLFLMSPPRLKTTLLETASKDKEAEISCSVG